MKKSNIKEPKKVKNYDSAKLEFEKALELRNFEIDKFWVRGWFFGALILAISSGYFANNTSNHHLVPSVCISFLLFIITTSQSLMNRGSKYWQERWEYVTKNRESELGIVLTKANKYNNNEKYYIDRCILSKGENYLTRSHRISVTKLAFLVWDILTLSAFMLWLNDIFISIDFNNINTKFTIKIITFHLVIGIYIFYFFSARGYVFEDITKTKKGGNDNHRGNIFFLECDNYIDCKID